MKIRSIIKPSVTWSFKKGTEEGRVLCNTCTNKDKRDSCPLCKLTKIQRHDLIAVKCNFYTKE